MDNNFLDNNEQNNDDFIIGKGFEITETEEAVKKTNKKSPRSNSTFKSLIWILSIIIVSVIIAFSAIYVGADYMGIGFGRGEEVTMEIKPGSSVPQIAEELREVGAVKMPFLFRMYAKVKKYDSQFKYGVYTFNTEAGYDVLSTMLIEEGAKAETKKVTIPEGTGINDYTKNVNGEKVTVPGIITLLEKNGVCTRSDFIDALDEVKKDSKLLSGVNEDRAYYSLEGYLFPETYDFYSFDSAECAKLAVNKMVKELENRITDDMYKRADELGYSMNEILTLASIIQMESGKSTKDMSGVSSVFHNRLNSDEFSSLGSSPTIYYGKSFRHDDGRYNTQGDDKFKAIKGLPPGPLCSPGIDAIKAALYPEKSDYYYFVTDSSGNFYYHKTFAEQSVTVSKLQQGKQWIYEYFD